MTGQLRADAAIIISSSPHRQRRGHGAPGRPRHGCTWALRVGMCGLRRHLGACHGRRGCMQGRATVSDLIRVQHCVEVTLQSEACLYTTFGKPNPCSTSLPAQPTAPAAHSHPHSAKHRVAVKARPGEVATGVLAHYSRLISSHTLCSPACTRRSTSGHAALAYMPGPTAP